MSLPDDAYRTVRTRVFAGLTHDVQRRRLHECEATGWPLRRSCADHTGLYPCPLCKQCVTAHPARDGIAELDAHPDLEWPR